MFDVVRQLTLRTSDGKILNRSICWSVHALPLYSQELTHNISHSCTNKVDFPNTKHEIQLAERMFKVC